MREIPVQSGSSTGKNSRINASLDVANLKEAKWKAQQMWEKQRSDENYKTCKEMSFSRSFGQADMPNRTI
jgi:hypothetical protein